MSAETAAAVLTGLTSLVVAVGAILSNRTKRVQEDVDEMRGEVASLRDQIKDALRYIYLLEQLVIGAGIEVPPRPTSLQVITGGRHRDAG